MISHICFAVAVIAFFQLSVSVSFAQDKISRFNKTIEDAVTAMETGHFDKALELLDSCELIVPGTINVPYERSLVYYYQKDYEKAGELLEELVERDDVTDQCYSMLGNCYDLLKEREKAIETYEEGIKKFPNSGPLYLERGVVSAMDDDYDNAVVWFEKGVEHAPYHSR